LKIGDRRVLIAELRQKIKNPDDPFGSSGFFNPGNYLVSHKVALAVPSALRGLTSVFGMGTGVTLSVRSPENLINLLEILKSQIPKFLHMKKFEMSDFQFEI
jgi:hypothetical protein